MDARDKLGVTWQNSENEKHGMFVMSFENKAGLPVEPCTFQLYVPALQALWGDTGIQEAYARRSEFQLVSPRTQQPTDSDMPSLVICYTVGPILLAFSIAEKHYKHPRCFISLLEQRVRVEYKGYSICYVKCNLSGDENMKCVLQRRASQIQVNVII